MAWTYIRTESRGSKSRGICHNDRRSPVVGSAARSSRYARKLGSAPAAEVVVVVVVVDADAGTDVLSTLMTIDKIRSTSLRSREKQTGIRDAR